MATEHPFSISASDNFASASPDEPTLVLEAPRRKRRWLRVVLVAALVAIIALIATGSAAYLNPPLLAPIGGTVLGTPPGLVAWNGTDPLNVLVMGIDQRTNETTHSDTMIVVHVDPASHDVKMLSIPRDMWVDIPAYGYWKINAAFANGYDAAYATQGLQGALTTGAQLAQLEVENALHIPLNYYAVLKFTGFKSVVDALGGVTVCVPHELNDPLYPADVGNGYMPIDIKAGCQHMNGTVALEYARERHAAPQGDLSRNVQQQALLDGIEKTMLSPGTLFRLPAVLSAARDAVITNLPASALPELGLLLGRAKGTHTQHYYINTDGGYVSSSVSADGQDILQPNWPAINGLVGQQFADPALRAENATVQVRDGQHTAGLAATYTGILQQMGFNVVAPRNADTSAYVRDLVIVNQDRPDAGYTARKLAQMFQASVAYRHIGADHPQIVVILGSDVAEGQ